MSKPVSPAKQIRQAMYGLPASCSHFLFQVLLGRKLGYSQPQLCIDLGCAELGCMHLKRLRRRSVHNKGEQH